MSQTNTLFFMYPLEIIKLEKKYGNFSALEGISFFLKKGEIFSLLGPNGAGKTTTISIISTLEKATSGTVSILGKNIQSAPLEAKAYLGVVPQETISHGFFTVEEILSFQSGFYGIKDNRAWIDYICKKLGLDPYRSKAANTLSGGYKRRLLFAKAIVHKPKLLILDEPTAGVDIELRERIWEFIRELNQNGMAILLTTHYLEEAEKLSDRVGIIHFGKIIAIDATKNLLEKYTSRKITFVLKEPVEKLKSQYISEQTDTDITFEVPRSVNLSDLIAESGVNWKLLKDIKIYEGSLEDAFRKIIKNHHT